MRSRKKRRLSQQELRELGVRPGLVAVRYHAGGARAEVRQLTAEGSQRRKDFIRRLTDESKASEGA